MSIDRANAELSHSPWLVSQRLNNFPTGSHHTVIKFLRIGYNEVREIGMVSELRWWQGVWAFTSHNFTRIAREDPPARVANFMYLESQHVPIEAP